MPQRYSPTSTNIDPVEMKFEQALDFYTKAIDLDIKDNKKMAIYYSNRAFANIKLENYGFAIEDASQAINKDGTYAKAYYRRASALFALGKYKNALANFKRVRNLSLVSNFDVGSGTCS